MSKFLLPVIAVASVMSMSAQTTYNYFDAADVDANGWLWFDTQAKIEKYVGFKTTTATPKIMLQSATFENADGEYAEPWADPEQPGCNASGELAGEGAKVGSIVLTPASATNDSPSGGGIMLWLPDCAEVDVYVSADANIYTGMSGARDAWVEPVDCGVVKTFMQVFMKKNYFLAATQGEVNDLQDLSNTVLDPPLAWYAEKGHKVTCLLRNNMKSNIYLHGIKVLTYTNSAAGVESVETSRFTLTANGKTLVASQPASIAVYNIAGTVVAKAADATSLDLSGLGSGAYVAKATGTAGSAVIKFAL